VDRLACVNIAALPLQLLLQREPEWLNQPAVVVEDDRPQTLVLFLNERARRLGVRSGQRYATALALTSELRAGTISQLQIEQRVHTLTDLLRRYSPHVEPSTGTPGVFWLDAQGLNRLYPSLHDWAHAVRLALQRAGFKATIAVGFTRFGACALAKFYRGTTVCMDVAQERAAVSRVPLTYVELDPDARERLLALGVETVGAFLRLPGDGIRQRFGDATAELYALAAGRRFAPLVPAPLEEPHDRQVHFDAPEIHAERLLFIVKRLLDSLLASLVRQALAVAELELWMKLDDRTTRTERVQPAASTIDPAQLLALVRLRLDALRLTAGIVTLRVAASACPASAHQRRLFALHTRRDPEAAAQAFARLRAEFHERVVVRARLCDAHLPSAQFVWEPIECVPSGTTARVVTSRPLVRRIYTTPQPASAPAQRLLGPYVISSGWWNGGVHRDYYFTPAGSNLRWVYYDHRQQQFFLQGGVE
jgi:protein ImuB